jgi:predicted nucleic acid-binding protein
VGRLIPPSTGLTYIDANIVIYRVEQIEPYLSASTPLWEALDDGRCRVATSELTWLEVLVKPLRERNADIRAYFELVLFKSNLERYKIDLNVLERAADLRASYRLKTPDSIHAATALLLNAVSFVTNDKSFRNIPGLNAVILDDIVAS